MTEPDVTQQPPDQRPYLRFVRRGAARVIRTVTEPETWTTEAGSVLRASRGDLMLTDGTREWSIDPGEFERTYRWIGDSCFERIGEVAASPAIPGEVVESAEGPETAAPGDWLVRNQNGFVWLVPATQFELAYCPLNLEVDESPPGGDEP